LAELEGAKEASAFSSEEFENWIQNGKAAGEYEEFLQKFGHRCLREVKR